jgi:hypothetical protein
LGSDHTDRIDLDSLDFRILTRNHQCKWINHDC